jgi:hypothetical protein
MVSVKGLKELKALEELESLSFHDTNVTDGELTELATMKQLRKLVLHHTEGVTDTGLGKLAALKHLEELSLFDTSVTAAGVAALKKALPKCDINY